MSGAGSPRRSCRRGRGSPRRWPRCCRCCTCTACPAATSRPALEQFLGLGRPGCRRPTITRLTAQWQDEASAFDRAVAGRHRLRLRLGRRDPPQGPPGAGQGVPAGDDRGPRRRHQGADRAGRRATASRTESWADLLRDCKRRGMRAPVLAVGDGALGFWEALREVFPETREQRCWFHKIANVLDALPKSAQPGAKAALAEICNAEDRDHARAGGQGVRGRLRRQVAQGGREDHRRPRRAAGVLRLPRRALDPPAHHQPDRVDLRHRPAPPAGHQGTRLPGRRRRDGVQAHRVRPSPLARRQRARTSSPWSVPAPASRRASSSNDPTNQEVISKSRDTPIHRS